MIAKEFSQGTNVAQRVRWIFAQGGGVTPNFDQTDTGIHVPHGTCMLDKVAGNKYGVAKKVNPVVVRVPNQTPEAYLDTVRRIRADYEPIHDQNPTTARTIINMSWGFTREQLGEGFLQWVEELAGLLQLLISKGALVVVPSGNGPPGNLVSQDPVPAAVFASAHTMQSQSTSTLRS